MKANGRTQPRTPYTTEFRNRRGLGQTIRDQSQRLRRVELKDIPADVAAGLSAILIQKNGGDVGEASGINFIEGSNIILTLDANGDIVNVEITAGNTTQTVIKTTTQIVNNSSIYQDDDELFFSIAANEKRMFEIMAWTSGPTAADIKFGFTYPAGCTVSYQVYGVGTGYAGVIPAALNLSSIDAPPAANTGIIGTNPSPGAGVLIKGVVLNASTAGTVTLQWAQATATVGDTKVWEGSWISATPEGGGGSGSGSGVDEFIELLDAPSSYTGFGRYPVQVNATETGLEFNRLLQQSTIVSAQSLSFGPFGNFVLTANELETDAFAANIDSSTGPLETITWFGQTGSIVSRELVVLLVRAKAGTGDLTISNGAGNIVSMTGADIVLPDDANGQCAWIFSDDPVSGNWYAAPLVSTGGGASIGTPALTFGTANAAGAATTAVGTGATIALFDATLPAAVGTAAVGVAGVAPRRDHVHAAVITAVTAGNWKVFYSNGTGVITELAVGAASTVLQFNGASSAPTATGTPQLSGINDTGGTAAITVNTTSPFVDITSLRLTSTTAVTMLTISPTQSAGAGGWIGLNMAPGITATVTATTITAINGNATVTGGSGLTITAVKALNFLVTVQNDGGVSSTTFTLAVGVDVVATASSNGATFTTTVTTLAGARLGIKLVRLSSGTTAVTTGYGALILTPVGTGTGKTITNSYGIYIQNQAFAGSTITTGLKVDDQTTGTTSKVFEFGTTGGGANAGCFYMAGNFTAAANATPLFISEGAGPTMRQLKTFDPGNLGVNFTAGQRVCVL